MTGTKPLGMAALVCLSAAAPLLGHQAAAGSVVNGALFTATALFGLHAGILLCFLPSVIALASGLLPAVLLPMAPFIIAGNLMLVAVFYLLKNKNYLIGVLAASAVKFIFLLSSGHLLMNSAFLPAVPHHTALMMSWPQLFTALTGGAASFILTGAVSAKNQKRDPAV